MNATTELTGLFPTLRLFSTNELGSCERRLRKLNPDLPIGEADALPPKLLRHY